MWSRTTSVCLLTEFRQFGHILRLKGPVCNIKKDLLVEHIKHDTVFISVY